MKVIMRIGLVFRKSKSETIRERFKKELDSDLIPMPGMAVFDAGLEREEVPHEVGANFEDGYYYVQFKDVEASAAGDFSALVNRFKKSGWHELRGEV